jgi:hypothetical protein
MAGIATQHINSLSQLPESKHWGGVISYKSLTWYFLEHREWNKKLPYCKTIGVYQICINIGPKEEATFNYIDYK